MGAQTLLLNGKVRMVALQFNSSKSGFIPTAFLGWLRRVNRETPEERSTRKSYKNGGIMVIEPTEKCSLDCFLGELEMAGYEIVDVLYQERINGNDPTGMSTYHMVRFLFARHEFAEISDEFTAVRNTARDALRHICESAMWRVRSFLNPFYKDGEEIPEYRAVSINLELRVPFFYPNGQPVVVWPKDDNGKRVGNAPLPIKANYSLRIVGGDVNLMTI